MRADELNPMARWAWLSLDERQRALPPRPPAPLEEAAQRRLAYWRRVGELEVDETFAWRLAHAGLDEDTFQTLISATPPSEAAPEPGPFVATHFRTLAAALESPSPETQGAPALEVLSPSVRQQLPFLPLLTPFLDSMLATLRGQQVPEALLRCFLDHAAERLHRVGGRTFVLNLHLARLEGRLTGTTPEERFQQFVGARDSLGDCLRTHPLLGRLLAQTTDRCSAMATELMGRLRQDRTALEEAGLLPGDAGELVAVQPGLSDSHGGGRTVAILTFASGARVVYKPRPLAVDLKFRALLQFLNARGFSTPLRTTNLLERGSHGYVEYITHEACSDAEAVRRFFHRQGGYLAILYALQATDFHNENLIAHGEHPVLVDLECLFHPFPRSLEERPAIQLQVDRLLRRSVLFSAMLPVFMSGSSGVIEVGGLGGRQGQFYPNPVPAWQRAATDEMHVGEQRLAMPPGQNLPHHAGVTAEPTRFVEELVEGFQEMYRLLRAHTEELTRPEGPIGAFHDVPVRHVVLPTWVYTTFLRDATHPDFMRSGADRDLAFERLWNIRARTPHLSALVQAERADLWNDDVPLFLTRPGSRDVEDGSGRRYHEVLPTSCLEDVVRNLSEWDELDCDRQVHYIRASMAAMEMNLNPDATHAAVPHVQRRVEGSTSRALAQPPAVPEEMIAAAESIGDQLLALALRAGGEASWLGLSPLNENQWQFAPLGTDLYIGNAGIALFLGQLYRVTGRERFAEVALEAAQLVRRLVSGDERHAKLGAYSGWPSMAYALFALSQQLGRAELRGAAVQALTAVSAKVSSDEKLDLIAGSAGTALVALRAHRIEGTRSMMELARACGERLLDTFRLGNDGQLMPRTPPVLGGLSHGAAGVAWAAAELFGATADERYATLVNALVTYEQSLFVPDWENWRDLRTLGTTDASQPMIDREVMAWCHGAPGIGLARLCTSPHVATPRIHEDIELALSTTRRFGWHTNQGLCHGSLGNAELLVVAAERLRRPELLQEARRWGATVLQERQTSGQWNCGVSASVDTPGLMTGLAGIGYQLLRLAAPSVTPSVLTLAPPLG